MQLTIQPVDGTSPLVPPGAEKSCFAIWERRSLSLCDEKTGESSEVSKLDSCYKAEDIQELLRVAEIGVGNDVICKYFEKGATR